MVNSPVWGLQIEHAMDILQRRFVHFLLHFPIFFWSFDVWIPLPPVESWRCFQSINESDADVVNCSLFLDIDLWAVPVCSVAGIINDFQRSLKISCQLGRRGLLVTDNPPTDCSDCCGHLRRQWSLWCCPCLTEFINVVYVMYTAVCRLVTAAYDVQLIQLLTFMSKCDDLFCKITQVHIEQIGLNLRPLSADRLFDQPCMWYCW